MENLIYLAKMNLYWIILYACFWLFFRKHTFFRLNRFYLLGTLLAAMFLPLIPITETTTENIPGGVYTISVSTVLQVERQISSEITDWVFFIFMIYLAGVIFMSFNMLKGLTDLFYFIKKGEPLRFEDHTLVLLPQQASEHSKTGSFSFFKWLVVTRNDYENCLENVLRHEMVHIRQKHSVDIMIVEFLKIIFWFNPVLWFYKISMQHIHEFLADVSASDPEDYAIFLISYSFNAPAQTLSNPFFNSSLLKIRIKMMFQNRTPCWLLSKYMIIFPVIGLLIILTAAREPLTKISDLGVKIIENNRSVQVERSVEKPEPLRQLKIEKPDKKLKTASSDTLPEKSGLTSDFKIAFYYSTNFSYSFYRGFSNNDSSAGKKENYLTAKIAPFQTISEIGRFLRKSIDFSEDSPPKLKLGSYRLGFGRRIPTDSVKTEKP
ncbi:M56 family metallopeptidase [Dyadobacter sp. 3J3]|uniref:M56 family metallopeptidase n=1 Tax=Dyadobacter sp. 3J3 TaxID=2606600 RepID=UPI00135B9342|nr:M56 family metallopeptidase [Dyadobacter sp. 3J3]